MVLQKITDEGYQPTWGFDFMRITALDQKSYKITPRELRRMIRLNPFEEFDVNVGGTVVKMKLADFLSTNTTQVMNGYITGTARRAEFIRRFGPKGETIQEIAGAGGQIDQELRARGERPLNRNERETIFYAIKANMGILPRQSFLGIGSSSNAFTYNGQQALQLMGNVTLMQLSAIASLAEPALIFGRTGMLGGLAA